VTIWLARYQRFWMVASGMERGARDSGERLDELLAKLQAR
jgi:hypothetical protein